MNAPTLSVCVVTQNRAKLLAGALGSVRGLATELVVVDGGSTDETVAIARAEPNVRVLERPFDDAAHQKNFAIEHARGDWILVVDDDERIGPRMRRRIPKLVRHPKRRWYKFPRYWLVDAAPLRYVDAALLYPDRQLRLFRNDPFFRYADEPCVHHHFPREGRGPGRKLRGAHIFHLDFLVSDRAGREEKVARYERMSPSSVPTNAMYLYEDLPHRIRPCRERFPELEEDLARDRG